MRRASPHRPQGNATLPYAERFRMGRVGFPGEPAPRNQRDIHHDQDSFVADAVKHRWRPSLAAFRKVDFLALEQFFHWMPRLRSRRQMLRQVIITSKIANAITVANTVMIVANERTSLA